MDFSAHNGASSASGDSSVFWELYRTTSTLSSLVQSPADGIALLPLCRIFLNATLHFSGVFFRSIQLEEALLHHQWLGRFQFHVLKP